MTKLERKWKSVSVSFTNYRIDTCKHMIGKIPNFLIERFELRHACAKKFPIDIQRFMFSFYDYYNWEFDRTLENIFVVMRSGITYVDKCAYPPCSSKRKIKVLGKKTKILECCCIGHASKWSMLKKYGVENPSHLTSVIEKRKNTNLEKYGCEYFFETDEFKEQSKQTNLKKYGCEFPAQNKSIKEKIEKTNLRKYGYKHALQNDIVKQKLKTTNLQKYGVEYPLMNSNIKEKSKHTNLEKYGCECSLSNGGVQEKSVNSLVEKYGVTNIMRHTATKLKQQNTMLELYGVHSAMLHHELKWKCVESTKKSIQEKYGVDNIMHLPDIVEKAQKHSRTNKTFTWKTGEVVSVQGYEPHVLAELEQNGYGYNDVKTNKADVPKIFYNYKGKKHRYYAYFHPCRKFNYRSQIRILYAKIFRSQSTKTTSMIRCRF